GVAGALLPAHAAPPAERALILLLLVGGPSQLDTFDPKPDAPSEIRGPFRAIETCLPGVRVSEHLPGLARRLDKVAVIRTLHHDAAPIHETGLQLVQTGRVCGLGADAPHIGSLAARHRNGRCELPPFVTLPGPIRNMGVAISRGQSAGLLGAKCAPFFLGADP